MNAFLGAQQGFNTCSAVCLKVCLSFDSFFVSLSVSSLHGCLSAQLSIVCLSAYLSACILPACLNHQGCTFLCRRRRWGIDGLPEGLPMVEARRWKPPNAKLRRKRKRLGLSPVEASNDVYLLPTHCTMHPLPLNCSLTSRCGT
jgi:hypothetical protein